MVDDRTAGQVIDARYQLLHPVGQGGMGVVWRAYDSLLGRDVAVKELRFPSIMPPEPRAALCERIDYESRRAATIEHPAVVRVLDVVEEDGLPFVVTELVEAPTLALQVDAGGPLPPAQVAAIGVDLLDALAAAHARGVVHRFVQPAKVLLPAGGGARLGDFGLAALIGDPLVSATGSIDSVSYMAPEQNGRPVGDAATDVWSVAATLFYAVEGRPPYDAGSARRTLAAIVSDPPRPLLRAGDLGPVLEAVLVKDPAVRPDVAAFRDALAGLARPRAAEPANAVEVGAAGSSATGDAPPWYAGETLADPADSPFFADVDEAPAAADAPARAAATDGYGGDDGVWLVGVAFGPGMAAPSNGEQGERETAHASDGPQLADVTEDAADPGTAAEPPPLPPKVALSRMFSPDVEQPPPPYEDAVPPDEPPPRAMWPLNRPWRPGVAFLAGVIIAVLVFLLLTGTRFLTGQSDRVARGGAATVNWVTYTDAATGVRIEHPSNWTVTPDGTTVDFRDPGSSAALRVAIQSSGDSPEQVWRNLEREFQTEYPSYQRIRLEPTTAEGRPAAAWEFTWTDDSGTRLHNSDLAVAAGGRVFALNFQTQADEWEQLEFLFDRFTSSFAPPA